MRCALECWLHPWDGMTLKNSHMELQVSSRVLPMIPDRGQLWQGWGKGRVGTVLGGVCVWKYLETSQLPHSPFLPQKGHRMELSLPRKIRILLQISGKETFSQTLPLQ